MSNSTHALLHEVIPFMDILTAHLDDFADNEALHPAVCRAAQLGRAAMNKHYSRTDESIQHRVAIGKSSLRAFIVTYALYLPLYSTAMHPAMKIDYMVKKDWEPDWIEIVTEIVREEWRSRYKPAAKPAPRPTRTPGRLSAQAASQQRAPNRDGSSASAAEPSSGKHTSEKVSTFRRFSGVSATWLWLTLCFKRMKAMFSTVPGGNQAGQAHTAVDPLEVYLALPPLLHVTDPLVYWDGVLKAKGPDAPLAQMALDFLSVPGMFRMTPLPYSNRSSHSPTATSCDAERAFSRGRLTVSRLRHSLADESVRANTLLGSWARLDGLVPEKTIIKSFEERNEDGAPKTASSSKASKAGSGKTSASANLSIPKAIRPPSRKPSAASISTRAAGKSSLTSGTASASASSSTRSKKGKGKASVITLSDSDE